SGPPLWALAASGLASFLPGAVGGRLLGLAILVGITLLAAGADMTWLADALGQLPSEPRTRAYAEQILASQRALGAARVLRTNGLERAEHDAILDLVAQEARPDERVGWIGVSSQL